MGVIQDDDDDSTRMIFVFVFNTEYRVGLGAACICDTTVPPKVKLFKEPASWLLSRGLPQFKNS